MESQNTDNSFIIQIKKLDGTVFTLEVTKNITVYTLKEMIKESSNIPVNGQRLLFNRTILQNDMKIEDYNISNQDIIFLTHVPINNVSQPSTQNEIPTGTPTNSTISLPAMFGGGNINVPENLLNSVMQNLMESPELIRMFIDSNPYLNEVRERNPELSHILDDPQLLRQSMELMRNPSLMREMTRTADRAMSNIEALPGGFNALRRMYQNFQEPIWNATVQRRAPSNETGSPIETPYNLRTEQPPNSEALPNPWDNSMNSEQTSPILRNPMNPRLNLPFQMDMFNQLASRVSNPTQESAENSIQPSWNPFNTNQNTLESLNNSVPFPSNLQSFINTSTSHNIPSPESTTQAQSNQTPSEARYSSQLSALRNMGFTDTQRCIQALDQAGGNLNRAIDRLLNE